MYCLKRAQLLIIVALVSTVSAACAEVRLPKILSDHAILQRYEPIRIWGWATPGEAVTVQFHGQERIAVANELGKWKLWFSPEAAGGPYTIVVSGRTRDEKEAVSSITLNDILVGDLWVASGQSNMQMPMKGFASVSAYVANGAEELNHADLNDVRLLHLARTSSYFPLDDISSSWTQCTKQTAADFSAIAYFFARNLKEKEQVPIGIIDATWGGTPIFSWLSMDQIGSDPGLMTIFSAWSQFTDSLTDRELILQKENREDDAAEKAGKLRPEHPWHQDGIPSQPASLYNGMIAPLTHFAIKGVIWYQGETETHDNPSQSLDYARTFAALIQDWRTHWGIGDFPFLYVQISSFSAPQDDEAWGAIRDAQRRVLSVNNTAMVVTLDVGEKNNVHPSDKQTVAARLALAAGALAYRKRDIEYSGPLFRRAISAGSEMRVAFDSSASGLVVHGPQLEGFELAGPDGKFLPATAQIDSSSVVIIQSQVVRNPVYVRYGWKSWSNANLFNGQGLPASTFTSKY